MASDIQIAILRITNIDTPGFQVAGLARNEGDEPGEKSFDVVVNGETVDTWKFDLDPDESDNGSTTGLQQPEFAKPGEKITVEVGGETESATVPGGAPSFDLSGFDVPDTVKPDGDVDISAKVKNTGEKAGTAMIDVAGRSDSTKVSPGKTGTLNVSIPASSISPPETATFENEEDGSDFASKDVDFSTEEPPSGPSQPPGTPTTPPNPQPDLSLDDVKATPPSRPGDPAEVAAVVSNAGDAPGDVDVTGPEGASADGVVDPDDERTFEMDVPVDPGDSVRDNVEVKTEGGERVGMEGISVDAPEPEPDPEPDLSLDNVEATPPSRPGDPAEVAAVVSNAGDAPGDVDVTTSKGASTGGVVDPDDERTFEMDVPVDPGDSVRDNVEVMDESGERVGMEGISVDAPEPESEPDLSLDDVEATPPSRPGDPAEVAVVVSNAGDDPGEVDITGPKGASADGVVDPDDERTFETDIPLDPGDSARGNVEVMDESGERVGMEGISVDAPEPEPDPEPDLSLDDVEATPPSRPGDPAEVAVVVSNAGDDPGEVDITGPGGASADGVVDPDDERTFDMDIPLDPGDSESGEVLVEDEAGDAVGREDITAEALFPSFELGDIDSPDTLAPGDPGEVTIPVKNTGDESGTATVTVNGTEHEVTVPSGGTEEVTHQIDPSSVRDGPAGLDIELGGETSEGETRQVTASEGETEFTIRNIDMPGSAPPGETVDGTITVANDGDVRADAQIRAGDTTETVDIEPSEDVELGFTVRKDPDQFQSVEFSVRDLESDVVDAERTRELNLVEDDDLPDLPGDDEDEPSPGDGLPGIIPDEVRDSVPGEVKDVFATLVDPLGIITDR